MIQISRLLPFFFAASLVTLAGAQSPSADRTTCFLPPGWVGPSVDNADAPAPSPPGFPGDSPAWHHYKRLWKSFHEDPSSDSLRRYLGFASKKSRARKTGNHEAKFLRGRGAPRWLAWKPGSYQQVETSHFTIYSRADRQLSNEVARSLEECYWVWTQMFFPLWEAAPQVSGHLASLPAEQSVSDFLSGAPKRITIRRRLSVVLFGDKQQYVATLGRDNPGIAQSTGFYSDDRRTTFLIGKPLDLPTLRHELVHQLFREATRSRLGNGSGNGSGDDSTPGARRDFWLVEGIAGYFESMAEPDGGTVTLGGWDSPRLQFARYRVLAGGDKMPLEELRRDGRVSAQSRTDLPRWYAHAIARTHQLLDSGKTDSRKWIYQKLAQLYKIDAGLGLPSGTISHAETLAEFLKVNDLDLQSNPPTRPLTQLCLSQCDLTAAGIASLPVSAGLRWLDLSGVPIKSTDVTRLLPQPDRLQQLSLEATQVDDQLGQWLGRAKSLRELDLSWTPTGDPIIESLSKSQPLSTLWMTGSGVTDASVDEIAEMKNLSSVDVQRTKIGESGLSRLKAARPNLTVNPLELISQ